MATNRPLKKMECKAHIGPFQSGSLKKLSLEELGIKHKTAKVPHGYLPIYERFFRDMEVNSLLEIGVADGASMKMWLDYFDDTFIVGIDKHPTFKHKHKNLKLLHGDVLKFRNDTGYISNVKYDVIIDDGSHIADEQIDAFKILWDFLNPGGLYVIEDLFTLYDPMWNPQNHNIIEVINARMKNILVGGDSISEVHYYGRNHINGILFLRKRKEPFRIQPLSEFEM